MNVMMNKIHHLFQREIIFSFIKMLELHDQYTKGHSKKVAQLAELIAREMDLSQSKIRQAYWTGMIHDIGKLLIPTPILNKKEALTDEEYGFIKKHPVWGYKALSESQQLQKIAKYVLYHHERWDGKGYPQGLKEHEIPLVSQIIAVADAWDAMRSDRAYRSGLSRRSAMKELDANQGTQFSPEVVEIFREILNKNKKRAK